MNKLKKLIIEYTQKWLIVKKKKKWKKDKEKGIYRRRTAKKEEIIKEWINGVLPRKNKETK